MGPVVVNYKLPDTVFTASTYLSGFDPFRARIDAYDSNPTTCAWCPAYDDLERWLEIALPDTYVIKGCVLDKMCDSLRYVTEVTVTTSDDDNTWRDVIVEEDISTRYDSDDFAYIWFPTSHTSPYWRIYMVTGNMQGLRTKADLIGAKA